MSTERDEIAKEVWHDIPGDEKLKSMSFSDLAVEIAGCPKDSPKFQVVEREMKKHIAKDQAKINRCNIILGACVGGIFGLIGVVLGYYLKVAPPTPEQVPPAATVQKMSNGKFTPKPPVGNVAPSQPTIAKPTSNPAPVQNNAQPSNHNP